MAFVARAYGFSTGVSFNTWNHSMFTTHSDFLHFLFLIKLEKCFFGEWSQLLNNSELYIDTSVKLIFMIGLRYSET
jgi:hypothetical protein